MSNTLVKLENAYWQAGILPETGASIAYGRAWNGSAFVDVMRPTAEADYGNSSQCASFLMLPWANRIGGGRLNVGGETYALRTTPDDGTARHGDVRGRAFTVTSESPESVTLTLDSRTQENMNWPFAFRVDLTYRLDGPAFVWDLEITNLDIQPFPAGFGHHPYFVRPTIQPVVQIPASDHFELTKAMATAAAVPVPPQLDFRTARALAPDAVYDNLLTGRINNAPAHLAFPDRDISLSFEADAIFAHWIIYAPEGKPFFAVEPQTNANNGFALYDNGIAGSGVFMLEPGETKRGITALHLL